MDRTKGLVEEFSAFAPAKMNKSQGCLANKGREGYCGVNELTTKKIADMAGAQGLKRAEMAAVGCAYEFAQEAKFPVDTAAQMAKRDDHIKVPARAFQMALLTAYALVTCSAIFSTNLPRK